MIYVAYNDYGDLIAESYTYHGLLRKIGARGYYEDEVIIGRITP